MCSLACCSSLAFGHDVFMCSPPIIFQVFIDSIYFDNVYAHVAIVKCHLVTIATAQIVLWRRGSCVWGFYWHIPREDAPIGLLQFSNNCWHVGFGMVYVGWSIFEFRFGTVFCRDLDIRFSCTCSPLFVSPGIICSCSLVRFGGMVCSRMLAIIPSDVWRLPGRQLWNCTNLHAVIRWKFDPLKLGNRGDVFVPVEPS